MKKKNKILLLGIFLILLAGHFYKKCINVISHLSPTYDEPVHLIEGYSYLKTGTLRIVHPHDHPMLAKIIAASGLLFLSPSPALMLNHPYWTLYPERYAFSNLTLYYNNHSPEKLLNSGRKVIILFSLLFAFLLFYIVYTTYGITSAVYSILLYTFSSTIIAHSSLVTQDLLVSGFYLLSIFSFYLWIDQVVIRKIEKKKLLYSTLCGISLGLSIVTKYSSLAIILTWGLILIWLIVKKQLSIKKFVTFVFITTIWMLVIIAIVYKIVYFPTFFTAMYEVIKNMQEGRSSFFLGRYSITGFREYFLVAFLIKTECGLLILFFVYTIIVVVKIIKKQPILIESILLLSIFTYFILASMSRMQIGHRHLLPIYPLIFWFTSGILKNKKFIPISLFLLIWYIWSSTKVHPWYLSYFNELVGGTKNGYKYLTDSNIDWGQGLKELGRWIDKHPEIKNGGIYFSYFGVGDPHYYGIKYRPIGFITTLPEKDRSGDDIVKNNFTRIVIAVSVTNLQSTYYVDKTVFNFLKTVEPTTVVAHSIFVYDITENHNLITEFLKLLEKVGYREDIEYIKSKFLS